ncbi:hypothetical protein DENSPDRAFT_910253 [Dentipellis sp. KUC8613]|nr:hypothetical protein DENSPDRAFT_910253 [Dentipellis sp. KUC8613]
MNGHAKVVDSLLSASLGDRAWPVRHDRTDKQIGIRLDFGKMFSEKGTQYRWIHVQANKGADQSTLRAIAQKNPHRILGSVQLDVKAPIAQEELLQEVRDILEAL